MTGGKAPREAGARFERDVVSYFVRSGYPYVERAYGQGRPDDRGDLDGLPGWVVQVKAERHIDLSGALDAAKKQCRDRMHFYAAIFKRRNHSTEDAYVVMPLSIFVAIAGDLMPNTKETHGNHNHP